MRHKFILALPTEITPVIAAVKNASVNELGTLTDGIVPFLNQKYVHNVTAPPPSRCNRHSLHERWSEDKLQFKAFLYGPKTPNMSWTSILCR